MRAAIFIRKFSSRSCPLLTNATRLVDVDSRSNKVVRVRFAPSPTGLLHLGGFRTALLNYLFSRKHGSLGRFILRIEDTDQSRLVPGATDKILDDLSWLGIPPDEGPTSGGQFGPYIQSQRLDIYESALKILIDNGHAYHCFCTEKRLDLLRKEAVKLQQKPRYDNKCRELTKTEVLAKKAAGTPSCIRFKMTPEVSTFNDGVYGSATFDIRDGNYDGDIVIVKSDGFPTYHFANVVDDHFMEITHVFRGVEWQISTPKHLQMYRAFGWEPPTFNHLPLIVNTDGTKLSKRQGDISITHYRDRGYFPKALVNFVTKAGGGFSDQKVDKLLSLTELSEMFTVSKISTHDCRLNFSLLDQLNVLNLKSEVDNNLPDLLLDIRARLTKDVRLDGDSFSDEYLSKILFYFAQDRVTALNELFAPKLSYLWSLPNERSYEAIVLSYEILEEFMSRLRDNDQSSKENLTGFIQSFIKEKDIDKVSFMKDLRLGLCGNKTGPPVAELITLFGPNLTQSRLEAAFDFLKLKQLAQTSKSQSVKI